ncbi:hypothetical protein [Pediococcus claussenii]|uniref:hypothetical protein n=1 Tax=Pediococcus claussenii TaxID=187452 RepID=UPI00081A9444|nr:hypothetical protein [Pediococcus claussenii]ANZ70357.1 hypothetical protein AYR57_08530 [Pediococcus claussenii]ANZ72173.1 hypothetical protein AYR58_08530 [Pediococcus claussenii]
MDKKVSDYIEDLVNKGYSYDEVIGALKKLESSHITELTKEQKLAMGMIETVFEDRKESMTKAVLYMERNDKNLRFNWNREYRAWKSLTEAEKNQIICELTLPF